MTARIFLAAIMFLAVPAAAQPAPPPAMASADCHDNGTICVSKAYASVEEQVSIFPIDKQTDQDAVKTLGVKIMFIGSDNLVTWSPQPEDKFCAATDCIYVLKTCNAQHAYTMAASIGTCTYKMENYAPADDSGMVPIGRDALYPTIMEIDYATTDALEAAEQNVFLGLGARSHKTFVPLSEVKTAASGP